MPTTRAPCPAAVQLEKLVLQAEKAGLTRIRIAEDQMRISSSLLSQWLTGRIKPGPIYRQIVAKWSGGRIAEGDWDEPAERALLRRVRPFFAPLVKRSRAHGRGASEGASPATTADARSSGAPGVGGTGA